MLPAPGKQSPPRPQRFLSPTGIHLHLQRRSGWNKVNEKMAVEDVDKLREEMVKQASELQQKRAEVLSLIQDTKAENEKATARKNLFTTTLAVKPPRKSSLQDMEPKKYKSPA